MRCPLTVASQRRVLCIFPAYTPSFGTFSHAYRFIAGVRAFMPPQGLLLIAAYMPEAWPVRFIDENVAPATAADFAWADVVFVSGMHIQRPQIHDIAARAKAAGKVTVLGGPSVSGAPEFYPDFDYLHIGEIGDATDRLIARLDESVAPPPAQLVFETKERLPLCDFPVPAYDLDPARPLSARQPAILQRLSVSLRVLRHSRAVRTAAAAEDAGADHRRTRRHAGAAVPSARWFISSTIISSATARRRAKCCRISSPGSASTAIRCCFPVRRRLISPSKLKFFR